MTLEYQNITGKQVCQHLKMIKIDNLVAYRKVCQEGVGMKPLIKWPGGKSSEIKYIEDMIPEFDTYYEPFFGGGALYFELEPSNAKVNDISAELIAIYNLLRDEKKCEKFKEELYAFVNNWERIDEYMEHFGDAFLVLYDKYKNDKISEADFENSIVSLFDKKIIPFNGLFSSKFCINQDMLRTSIQRNVIAKLRHIKKRIDTKNQFSRQEIMKNIETAFRSGFYLHFRDVLNRTKTNKIKISEEKEAANYYFVREFCYGGMFRFNRKGEFNVPYGGNAYNKKDFRKKVDYLFSNDVQKLFKRTEISNLDFEEFLEKHKPGKNDFVFFDPPYDTEFSEYEENPFTKEDQKRLAEVIRKLDAKFILIIKETPFILGLYKGIKGVKITKFGKSYLFGIKGRTDREVTHLIIHNIDESQQKLNLALLG